MVIGGGGGGVPKILLGSLLTRLVHINR